MRREISKAQIIVRLVIAVIITAVVFEFFLFFMGRFIDGNMQNFSDGWSVNYNGQITVDANLNKYRFSSKIRKGDVITLQKKIPKTVGDEVILTFDAQLSAVNVQIDGNDIYEYGYNLVRKDLIPGDATHLVILPTNAAGRRCLVSIEAGADGAFRTLPTFNLVPAQNKTAAYTNRHIISNIVALFLFTMGIVLIIIAIAQGIIRKRYQTTFAIGSLAFCVGIWTLCQTHLIEMFSQDYVLNTLLGYLAFYVSTIPLISIMYLLKGGGRKIWQKVCVGISYAITCASVVLVLSLTLSRTFHPEVFFMRAQIVDLIAFVFMIAGTSHDTHPDTPQKIYNAALVILFAGCIYDVIRYYISVLIRIDSGFLFVPVIPASSFIFIIMMMVAYLARLDSHYMHEAELEIADQIAFTDVVTGLKNRTYCNHLFDSLESRPAEEKFQIVSFDINGVTKVNDTLGRKAGDMLIKDCADIISKSFAGVGEVIRMGGDEFIAVVENGKYRDVKSALSRMEKFEAQYEFRRKYEIRVSYGAASSDEKDGITPEEVYHRANERMYSMKKETKYSAY